MKSDYARMVEGIDRAQLVDGRRWAPVRPPLIPAKAGILIAAALVAAGLALAYWSLRP